MKRLRNEYQVIRDYVEMINKPFSAADVIEETGVCKTQVYHYLILLEKYGIITRVLIESPTRFFVLEKRQEIAKEKRTEAAKLFFSKPMNKLLYYLAALAPVALFSYFQKLA